MKNKSVITRIPKEIKSSFFFLLVSIFQKGLSFLLSPIFIRIMDSNEYGLMSVYSSYEELFGTIAMFCLSFGCFDVGMQNYKNDRYRYMFSILILSNIITIVTAIFFVIIYPYIKGYLQISTTLLFAMFISFILSPAFTFWTREERYKYKYLMPTILTLISSFLVTFISILSVYLFPNNKVEAKIVSSLMVMIPMYIILYLYIGRKANFRINLDYIKFAFFFNLPIIPHYLSSYVLNSSDQLMIASLIGTSESGYYHFAYSISSVVKILWSAISVSLTPYLYEKYEKNDYNSALKRVTKIIEIFGFTCLATMFICPEVIKIIGTEEFLESIYVIPPVLCAVFFESLYYIFTSIVYFNKKPKYVMYASIVSASLNILLNYILIPKYGYLVAAYTTLICFALQAFLDYIVAKKFIESRVFDKKQLLFFSIFMIICSSIISFLYKSIIIRYIILSIIVVLLIYKKETIVNLLLNREKDNIN